MKKVLSLILIITITSFSLGQVSFAVSLFDALTTFANEFTNAFAGIIDDLLVEFYQGSPTRWSFILKVPSLSIYHAEHFAANNPQEALYAASRLIAYIKEVLPIYWMRVVIRLEVSFYTLTESVGFRFLSGIGGAVNEILSWPFAYAKFGCAAWLDIYYSGGDALKAVDEQLKLIDDIYFKIYECDKPDSPNYDEAVCNYWGAEREKLIDFRNDLIADPSILKDWIKNLCPAWLFGTPNLDTPNPDTIKMGKLNVIKDGSGKGRVTGDDGFYCHPGLTSCAKPYEVGRVVKLEASPQAGSVFTGWSLYNSCNGSTSPCDVTIADQPITEIKATFNKQAASPPLRPNRFIQLYKNPPGPIQNMPSFQSIYAPAIPTLTAPVPSTPSLIPSGFSAPPTAPTPSTFPATPPSARKYPRFPRFRPAQVERVESGGLLDSLMKTFKILFRPLF